MIYLLSGVVAYLLLGFYLTHSIFKGASWRRMTFRDVLLGSVFMPVVSFFLLLFTLFQDLWKRLLIALDFDPPEEMRAGPKEPGVDDIDLDGTQ